MPRLLSSLSLSLLPLSRARRYAQQKAVIPGLFINNNNFGRQRQRQRRLLHAPSQQQQIPHLKSTLLLLHQERGIRMMSGSGTTETETDVTVTSSHYENHSKEESYEDAYFYEPGEYMEHLINLCRNRLQISPEQPDQETQRKRCILDIGGGTGNFAKELIQQNDNSRIVVIDPFLIGDDNNDNNDIVSFIKAPAEDFLTSTEQQSSDDFDWRTNIIEHKYNGYDQILLKEVIHHFNEKDRIGIFRGMKDGLRRKQSKSTEESTDSYPSILIITRPQIDIDYPLWKEAKDVWKQNQPSIESIKNELEEAGYTNIVWNVESYPCSIQLNRWTEMIKSRFWSTFSNFTDQQLDEACNEITIKAKAAKDNNNDDNNNDNDDNDIILRFEDRLIFLTAS
jgi:SAM-dependent methyltransferase